MIKDYNDQKNYTTPGKKYPITKNVVHDTLPHLLHFSNESILLQNYLSL